MKKGSLNLCMALMASVIVSVIAGIAYCVKSVISADIFE